MATGQNITPRTSVVKSDFVHLGWEIAPLVWTEKASHDGATGRLQKCHDIRQGIPNLLDRVTPNAPPIATKGISIGLSIMLGELLTPFRAPDQINPPAIFKSKCDTLLSQLEPIALGFEAIVQAGFNWDEKKLHSFESIEINS
jgi:hypothetical protein